MTQAHIFNKEKTKESSYYYNQTTAISNKIVLTSGFITLFFLSFILSLENKHFKSLSSRDLTENIFEIWKKITNWH